MKRLLALLAAVTFCYYAGTQEICNTMCMPPTYGGAQNCTTTAVPSGPSS